NKIVIEADEAIKGKIKTFSALVLDYGNPINWHYNPITKSETPTNIKWYKIPDFDPARGDIKVIWEASRFTHFLLFARAYIVSKDEKYYRAFSHQLDNWLKKNIYSYGANYKCGQESTLRMINALLTFSVFEYYQLTNITDLNNIKSLIESTYKKVLSNFFYAHKCIKNNHTLSEITGLILGAWCSEDEKRLAHAYNLMDEEIKKQFFADGGYAQYSFNYQRLALQLMELVLGLNSKTGFCLNNNSLELIEKSVLQMYQLQIENGDMPNYGSNDGALIFPLSSCDYRDFKSVLNTVYALLKGQRLYDCGKHDEELLWFGNTDIKEIPVKKLKHISDQFTDSGFYSFRKKELFLLVLLKNYKVRPGHNDQLHLDLWYKGVNIFCDAGSYSYASELGVELSSTTAHNTVKVKNKEQMNKHGPFLVYDWSEARVTEFNEHYFKGKMKSKNGYEHVREIILDACKILITDEVIGTNEYGIIFNTPCECVETNFGISLLYKGAVMCDMYIDGAFQIDEAYRSLYYLKKEKISRIRINGDSYKTKIELNLH
ncbi:hypothetical protein GX831_03745, partial [bacterium]|nr:hypothetical protein [bacterium]